MNELAMPLLPSIAFIGAMLLNAAMLWYAAYLDRKGAFSLASQTKGQLATVSAVPKHLNGLHKHKPHRTWRERS